MQGTYHERTEKIHRIGQFPCNGGGPLAQRPAALQGRETEYEWRPFSDDLTPRAEEFGTLKACINVDHIGENIWGPPLVDADWYVFSQAIYKKELKDVSGKSCTINHYRERSMATGAKNQVRVRRQRRCGLRRQQKTGDEFSDSARKGKILGRNQTRLELWEEYLKDPITALNKALKCVENQYQG